MGIANEVSQKLEQSLSVKLFNSVVLNFHYFCGTGRPIWKKRKKLTQHMYMNMYPLQIFVMWKRIT